MMKRRSECKKIKEYMQKAGCRFGTAHQRTVKLQVKERPDNILEDRKHVLHQMWERNQE